MWAGGRYAIDLSRPTGQYRFTAKATDDKGASVTSEALLVSVPNERP